MHVVEDPQEPGGSTPLFQATHEFRAAHAIVEASERLLVPSDPRTRWRHSGVEYCLLLGVRPSGYTAVWGSSRTLRSRKLLLTTNTELNAIAPAAMIGLSCHAEERVQHAGRDRDADDVVDERPEQIPLDRAHRALLQRDRLRRRCAGRRAAA